MAGGIGIALLPRRLAFILYTTLAIYLVFDWMYRCGNWYQVILPAYPLLLLGVAALVERWEQHWAASRRWLAYAPLILLAGLLSWRIAASWERADSRDRPGDTALDHAAILLDQPLPAGAALFAPVAGALALDYLIQIWGLQPAARTVSSTEAGDLLRQGQVVLTDFAGAPVLLSELPQDLALDRQAFSPDWLLLQPEHSAAAASPAAVRLDQEILPGLTLLGYSVQPAPQGEPITRTAPGVDVTLAWKIAGGWPAGAGISLRPTAAGEFIADPARNEGAILQRDAGAPLQGLLSPATGKSRRVNDAHRVPLPAGADGITLIVYRSTTEGFTNLYVTPLTLPAQERP
jgi:hypothetical protein